MYTTSDIDGDQTVFYYELDDIFDKASIQSMYRAESMDNTDKYAMSENERDFFNARMKNGAAAIFKKISRLSKGVSDGFQYNASLDDYSSIDTDYDNAILYITELPTYWENNMSITLDSYIEEALVSYILKEWFRLRGMMNEHREEEINFQNLLSVIKGIASYRTTRPGRTYNMSIPTS